jgi:signal transduction protein with GAF and PtsI domain
MLLLPILDAVASAINSTFPIINIPAQIVPLGQSAATNTAASTNIAGGTNILSDGVTLGAILTGAGTLFTYLKNHFDDAKQDKRTVALANAQLSMSDSLRQTDEGVKDNVTAVNALVMTLARNPDLSKLLTETQHAGALTSNSILDLIKDQKDGWDEDIKTYYINKKSSDDNFSNDSVLKKTATVAQQTTPTPA